MKRAGARGIEAAGSLALTHGLFNGLQDSHFLLSTPSDPYHNRNRVPDQQEILARRHATRL